MSGNFRFTVVSVERLPTTDCLHLTEHGFEQEPDGVFLGAQINVENLGVVTDNAHISTLLTDNVGNVYIPENVYGCDHAFEVIGRNTDTGYSGDIYARDVPPGTDDLRLHVYFDVPSNAIGFTIILISANGHNRSFNLGI